MHAASVHPEPGSNSRANCIETTGVVKILCRACLALFTSLSMSWIRDEFKLFSFQRNFEILFTSFACTSNLLLFNCQWSARVFRPAFMPPFFGQPEHYITSVSVCQEVFEKFFEFFSKTFSTAFLAGAEVPEYYITLSFVCQEVFQKFFQLFSWFFSAPFFEALASSTACIL